MVVVWLIAALVSACVFGFAGAYISRQKNREPIEGILFGVLLGPLGLVIAAVMPSIKAKEQGPVHSDFPVSRGYDYGTEPSDADEEAAALLDVLDQEARGTGNENSRDADLDAAALLDELDAEAGFKADSERDDDLS